MSTPTGWARGYPVVEPYPASWHHFQSPAHLAAICALMGVAWDVGPGTPLSIAEIGCGTGYTANVLAAGNPNATVLGLDYNPAHIAEARAVAGAAGLGNVGFAEIDLAELDGAELDRLPEFDLVTVHGVWSWVDDPVREGVLRLLRRRLKPGGVVLMTYNALPGASAALGLWRLVRATLLAHGSTAAGLAAARVQLERLLAAEPRHLPPSGWSTLLLSDIGLARQGYLLHEFLTEHWRPSFFGDVAAALAGARCAHVGSASIDENFLTMTLSPAQQVLWNEAPDAAARELLTDFCVPRAFRRDVFMRGLRRIRGDQAVEAITLVAVSEARIDRKLVTQAGEAMLPPHIIGPMQAALAERPCSIRELRALPGVGGVTAAELLAMLVGSGAALPLWRAPGDIGWEAANAAARRLNAVAAARLAPHGLGAARLALASPALGGGLGVDPLELALAGLLADPPGPGGDAPAALAARLLPPGPPPPAEVVADLEGKVATILRDRRSAWRYLGIT
jgi:SAM-dependent methyltransferase